MELREISLSGLVDLLDETESEYADFFRPMLGYEALLKLYDGIDDSAQSLLTEIEDEIGFQIPSDLIAFYLCSNGGEFADLSLFPITDDPNVEKSLHFINALDATLKTELGIDKNVLVVGQYEKDDNYITCTLNNDGIYAYQLWDSKKKKIIMEFEYLLQLIALEMSYATDPDSLMDFEAEE